MAKTLVRSLALLLPLVAGVAAILNASCAPGGNFDLSVWTLQLPYAGDDGQPAMIQPEQLDGCGGFENFTYFFTESGDGAMVMKAPGDPGNPDCVTTPGSQHCRTEFRESDPAAWSTNATTNRLFAQLAGEAGASVVIGQAFQANSTNSKPVAELYYNSSGYLNLGVEYAAEGGQGESTNIVGQVDVGTVFTYELIYEQSQLSIIVNNGTQQFVDLYFETPQAYFKAGCYNQGTDTGDIHFFQLTTTHED